ncbi:MAG: hypothetical protein WCR48_01530 [Bacteroidales bacterium]
MKKFFLIMAITAAVASLTVSCGNDDDAQDDAGVKLEGVDYSANYFKAGVISYPLTAGTCIYFIQQNNSEYSICFVGGGLTIDTGTADYFIGSGFYFALDDIDCLSKGRIPPSGTYAYSDKPSAEFSIGGLYYCGNYVDNNPEATHLKDDYTVIITNLGDEKIEVAFKGTDKNGLPVVGHYKGAITCVEEDE